MTSKVWKQPDLGPHVPGARACDFPRLRGRDFQIGRGLGHTEMPAPESATQTLTRPQAPKSLKASRTRGGGAAAIFGGGLAELHWDGSLRCCARGLLVPA